jgi:NTP pyrophosphatase (non-canonical NTP hydrolase)
MLSVSLEASELLELAQRKDDAALEAALAKPDFRRRLGEECADFFLCLLTVCERAGIDLTAAADAEFDANSRRHPANKARRNARKHSELRAQGAAASV